MMEICQVHTIKNRNSLGSPIHDATYPWAVLENERILALCATRDTAETIVRNGTVIVWPWFLNGHMDGYTIVSVCRNGANYPVALLTGEGKRKLD